MDSIRAHDYKPFACVEANGIVSAPFGLTTAKRQGCPFSIRIFVLASKPLACTITYYLFAVDILLTLSNPGNSVPHLFQIINEFGSLSGYKLNELFGGRRD